MADERLQILIPNFSGVALSGHFIVAVVTTRPLAYSWGQELLEPHNVLC